MKKFLLSCSIFVFALIMTGCASVDKGRFSVIDLDLRTPEQIVADISEKTCIYTCTNKPPQIAQETERAFPIDILFKLLSVVKGRLTIISLEWKTKE